MQTVSVVMATFNGEAWLGAQLESIAAQTRLPERLIISDDGSSDGTREIARRFAQHAPFEVLVLDGPGAGADENFWHAVAHASTDVIAWCDQDDVWHPQKLQLCEQHMEATGVRFVTHAAVVTDASLVPTGRRFPDYRKTRVLEPFEGDWWLCAPGFSQFFRADLLAKVRWEEQPTIGRRPGFDGVPSLLAFATGTRLELSEPLTYYRQHGRNLAGPARQFGPVEKVIFALSVDGDAFAERAKLAAAFGRFVVACDPSNERAKDYFALIEERCLRRSRIHHAPQVRGAMAGIARSIVGGDYTRTSRGGFGALAFGRDVVSLGLATARRTR